MNGLFNGLLEDFWVDVRWHGAVLGLGYVSTPVSMEVIASVIC